MKNILSKVVNVGLGSDLWKNRKKEYFLALTAHFFDDNLNYRSILYSFRQFKEYHFSNQIKPFIQKQLRQALSEKVNHFHVIFKIMFSIFMVFYIYFFRLFQSQPITKHA